MALLRKLYDQKTDLPKDVKFRIFEESVVAQTQTSDQGILQAARLLQRDVAQNLGLPPEWRDLDVKNGPPASLSAMPPLPNLSERIRTETDLKRPDLVFLMLR